LRILLFNPNRSLRITERMAASARAELRAPHRLLAVTGSAGPLVVHDACTLQQADAAALCALPGLMQDADALLLAISLDGVIDQLRPRLAPKPALGMTEAAVAAAAALGGRVGLLTLGPGLLPLYRARLAALLPQERIAGVQAPELPLAFAPDVDAAALLPVLLAASQRLVRSGARSVVLAGAVLCGHDPALQAALGVPVLDGVRCAMRKLQDAA
jgi:allantoin racemase